MEETLQCPLRFPARKKSRVTVFNTKSEVERLPYSAEVVYTLENGSKFKVPVKGYFSGKAIWKSLHFSTEILEYYVEDTTGVMKKYTADEMEEMYQQEEAEREEERKIEEQRARERKEEADRERKRVENITFALGVIVFGSIIGTLRAYR